MFEDCVFVCVCVFVYASMVCSWPNNCLYGWVGIPWSTDMMENP